MVWRSFWPEKFRPDGIDLWSDADAKPAAQAFLKRHFRKVVALRCTGEPRVGRYISPRTMDTLRESISSHACFPARNSWSLCEDL